MCECNCLVLLCFQGFLEFRLGNCSTKFSYNRIHLRTIRLETEEIQSFRNSFKFYEPVTCEYIDIPVAETITKVTTIKYKNLFTGFNQVRCDLIPSEGS